MDKIPNRFALATVASKRWEQIMQGGRPMIEFTNPKSLQVVLREIESGKLHLNLAEKTIEKLGSPIPLPPPPAPEPEPLLPSPVDGKAA